MDGPMWLLTAAVRCLPTERGEWGAAMRAELAHIQHPRIRWQFAWGCARVALFPPRRGGFLMNDRMKYWRTTFGIAALFSLLLNGMLLFLALFSDNPEIQSGAAPIPLLDFFRNWLVLTLIFTPIVSGLRTGEPRSMKDWLIPFGAAILFGLLLIAPFACMEYWNNPRIQSGEFRFPVVLFFGLWLMPTICFLAATPIVRGLRAGESMLAHPIALLLRVGFLGFVAIGWVNLVRDQMPCFLGGVPGCD
jgi:hypothetical protein